MNERPPPLAYRAPAVPPPLPRANPLRLLAVPPLCLVAAWVVGAITSGVNGVSRAYFDSIYGWMYGGPVPWGDIVLEGLLESTAFGLLLTVVFALAHSISTGCRAAVRGDVTRAVALAVYVCLACWMLGGLAGAAWAAASPHGLRQTFDAIVITRIDRMRWGFVGGSNWGAFVGGLAAIVTACVALHVRWRRSMRPRATEPHAIGRAHG